MKVRKPISTKLAIVTVVSLAFELALMCLLYSIVMEGIKERQAQAKAASITWQINTCMMDALTMAIMFAFVQMTESQNYKIRLQEALKDAGEGLEKMSAIVAGEEPSFVDHAKTFATLIDRQRQLIEKTTGPALPSSVQLSDPGGFASSPSLDGKLKVLRFLSVYRKLTLASVAAREKLMSVKYREQEGRSIKHNRLRERNILLLQSALCASFLICILMGLILHRSIAQRLNLVRTNAEHFGADLAVVPIASAGDEIDEINRLFLDMTASYKDAKYQEEIILENASSVICTIDTDGRILSTNSAAQKLWGVNAGDLLGLRLNRYMSESQAAELPGHLQRIAKEGKGVFETRMELPGSSSRDIEWTASTLDANNCLVCIAHDVTEKKNLEKLKREFAEIIRGDLSDSLSLIKGVLSDLRAHPEIQETLAQKASSATTVADRLSALVTHMTELSGAKTSTFTLVPASLLIERAVSSLSEWAQAREVSITHQGVDEKVLVDEERIIRVLINLISNAVKFSSAGSLVHVLAREDNQQVEFEVSDQGPGIDPAYREIIFQRFEQIEDETGKSAQGAGLGLAICKSIIDEHQGELGVRGVEPTGSCFWFRLKTQVGE